MKKILLIFLILFGLSFSQDKNADLIIEKVKANFDLINDYVVQMKGKVELPDAVIPELNAKIYFKKPDKFKVESDNFMIIPKQSIRFDPEILYRKDFTALFVGENEIGNIKHYIIKLVSNDPEFEQVVTLWVNSKNYTIKKVAVIGSRVGKVEIEFDYSLVDGKYWLPEKLIASFEASNFLIPKLKRDMREQNQKISEIKEGKITIYYSNYIVNKGINDKIFEDQKKSLK